MRALLWTGVALTVLAAACGGGDETTLASSTTTTTTLPDETTLASSATTTTTLQAGGPSERVGAAGGVVVSDDSNLRVDIPAGALAEDTLIEVVEVSAADLGLDATALTGTVYDLLPDGLTFSAPVTVTRSFDAAAAGIGTDEVPWMIMAHGGTEGWEFLSSTTTRHGDTVEVSAEVTHFTGNFVVDVHRILAFDAETKLTLTPASFTADVGSGAQVALSVDIARAINPSDVDTEVFWRLTRPLTGNPGDTGGMVTCDDEGNGTYSATLIVEDKDFVGFADVLGQIFLGGESGFHTITSPTFELTVVGSATCNLKAGTADAAPEVASTPDGSFFVEVIEGSATGGNTFSLIDGSHIGPNTGEPLSFFAVFTPVPQGQTLIVVPNPPLFPDGTSALGIELFQGDQRQGCGATPETTTNITGNVGGLATNGDSVGCLQEHDPTQPATLFFYVVIGDTILDFSFTFEPNALLGVGSIVSADGIASFHSPDGPPFPILNDLDGDGVHDLFQWVTGGE